MTGVAERIEITYGESQREQPSEWAPYRGAAQDGEGLNRSRSRGLGGLAAFLLLCGVTVAVARGQAGLAESYQISPQSLLVVAWMVQGAAALLCFMLAVRWLRS